MTSLGWFSPNAPRKRPVAAVQRDERSRRRPSRGRSGRCRRRWPGPRTGCGRRTGRSRRTAPGRRARRRRRLSGGQQVPGRCRALLGGVRPVLDRASPRRTAGSASAPGRPRRTRAAGPAASVASHTTPSRSSSPLPSSQPVAGATPMPTTTTSASTTLPSLSRTRSTRPSPSMASTPTPRRTSTPWARCRSAMACAEHRARARGPAAPAAPRSRVTSRPRTAGGRRHLGADEPGADHHHPPRPGVQGGPQRQRVVEGAQHEHALEVGLARQPPGCRSGGQHDALVRAPRRRRPARPPGARCRGPSARTPSRSVEPQVAVLVRPCGGGCGRAPSRPASTFFDSGGRS